MSRRKSSKEQPSERCDTNDARDRVVGLGIKAERRPPMRRLILVLVTVAMIAASCSEDDSGGEPDALAAGAEIDAGEVRVAEGSAEWSHYESSLNLRSDGLGYRFETLDFPPKALVRLRVERDGDLLTNPRSGNVNWDGFVNTDGNEFHTNHSFGAGLLANGDKVLVYVRLDGEGNIEPRFVSSFGFNRGDTGGQMVIQADGTTGYRLASTNFPTDTDIRLRVERNGELLTNPRTGNVNWDGNNIGTTGHSGHKIGAAQLQTGDVIKVTARKNGTNDNFASIYELRFNGPDITDQNAGGWSHYESSLNLRSDGLGYRFETLDFPPKALVRLRVERDGDLLTNPRSGNVNWDGFVNTDGNEFHTNHSFGAGLLANGDKVLVYVRLDGEGNIEPRFVSSFGFNRGDTGGQMVIQADGTTGYRLASTNFPTDTDIRLRVERNGELLTNPRTGNVNWDGNNIGTTGHSGHKIGAAQLQTGDVIKVTARKNGTNDNFASIYELRFNGPDRGPSTLIVNIDVVNNDGGTADADDFTVSLYPPQGLPYADTGNFSVNLREGDSWRLIASHSPELT